MDNVRAAWSWAAHRGKPREILEMYYSLDRIYEIQGWHQQGEAAFAQAVDTLRTEEPGGERGIALGAALYSQACCALKVGNQRGRKPLRESWAILRRLGARRELAPVLIWVASAGLVDTDAEAEQLVRQSLSIHREIGIPYREGWSLVMLGIFAIKRGAYEEAEQYCRQALQIHRSRHDRANTSMTLTTLGWIAYHRHAYVQARQYFEQALAAAQEVGFQNQAAAVVDGLGDVAMAMGEHEEAERHYRQGLAESREIGHYRHMAVLLAKLGNVALATGAHQKAAGRYRQAIEVAIDRRYADAGLSALSGVAALLVRTAHEAQTLMRAVEWAALASSHPESLSETREQASALLDQCRARLTADAFAAAERRGRARDLWGTVEEARIALEERAL